MTPAERIEDAVTALSRAMTSLQSLIPDGDTDNEDDPIALAWRAVDATQTDLLEVAGELSPISDLIDLSAMHRLRQRGEI